MVITMRALPLLFLLLIGSPALAGDWAIFYIDPATKRYPERSDHLWRGKIPTPGVNIASDALVLELPDGYKDIHDYKRVQKSLVYEPEAPPAPTAKEVAERNAKKEIDDRLDDATLTDAQFIKLFRLSRMKDPAVRKAELDKIKAQEGK